MYELVEKLLKENGISAYRLCKDIGISTSTIAHWKKGAYTPKQDTIKKIADYFGVTVDYLLTGEIKSEELLANTNNFTAEQKKEQEELLQQLIQANFEYHEALDKMSAKNDLFIDKIFKLTGHMIDSTESFENLVKDYTTTMPDDIKSTMEAESLSYGESEAELTDNVVLLKKKVDYLNELYNSKFKKVN